MTNQVAAATPEGLHLPLHWNLYRDGGSRALVDAHHDRVLWLQFGTYRDGPHSEAIRAFIAEAVNAYSTLLAERTALREALEALTVKDWMVERISCYEEEGVEGWRWTAADGREWVEIGAWDEIPEMPAAARAALGERP